MCELIELKLGGFQGKEFDVKITQDCVYELLIAIDDAEIIISIENDNKIVKIESFNPVTLYDSSMYVHLTEGE